MGANVVETRSVREWVKELIQFSNGHVPTDHGELPTNTQLLELLLTDPNFSLGWSSFSKSEKANPSLLNMLNSVKGCPLYLYNNTVKWAKDNLSSGVSSGSAAESSSEEVPKDIASMLRTREACLSHFEHRASTTSIKPEIQEPFPLKHSSGTVPPYKSATCGYTVTLCNTLTDVDLMQDNKLLINGASPYIALDQRSSVLNDINTGPRYISA